MLDRQQLDRWMTAAADGDRTAIDPLFHALWPAVTAYATRMLGDRALAEDVAQDVLVALFGRSNRYDRSRDALTWALALTTWQCRSARRKLHRRGESPEGSGTARASDDAIDGRELAEDRELVRAALATLETLVPRDVEVIAAACLDDDDLRRALAPATFRKRLERALGRLRFSWRSRHGAI